MQYLNNSLYYHVIGKLEIATKTREIISNNIALVFLQNLKHDYDVIHFSFCTLFSPNVQINAYRPKCSERIDSWTVSKDIGQLANTTQTVVFLKSSSVLSSNDNLMHISSQYFF